VVLDAQASRATDGELSARFQSDVIPATTPMPKIAGVGSDHCRLLGRAHHQLPRKPSNSLSWLTVE